KIVLSAFAAAWVLPSIPPIVVWELPLRWRRVPSNARGVKNISACSEPLPIRQCARSTRSSATSESSAESIEYQAERGERRWLGGVRIRVRVGPVWENGKAKLMQFLKPGWVPGLCGCKSGKRNASLLDALDRCPEFRKIHRGAV